MSASVRCLHTHTQRNLTDAVDQLRRIVDTHFSPYVAAAKEAEAKKARMRCVCVLCVTVCTVLAISAAAKPKSYGTHDTETPAPVLRVLFSISHNTRRAKRRTTRARRCWLQRDWRSSTRPFDDLKTFCLSSPNEFEHDCLSLECESVIDLCARCVCL